MKLEAVAKPGESLGARFFLVSYLPTYAATVFLLVLVWAGAPGRLRFDRAWRTAAGADVGEVLLLILAITLIGVLTQPLQLALVRLLEGYWPARLGRLTRLLVARQRRAHDRLAAAAEPPGLETATQEQLNAAGLAGTELRRRYPARTRLRATAFGNALAAAESRAGQAYGWDAVVAWPRLYPVLGDKVRAVVDDRRDTMDVAARFTVVSAVTALVTLVLLSASGWWLLLTLVPTVIGVLAYRGAVAAALAYGESLEAAFDLHRFDLLTALHLPLPSDPDTERRQATATCLQWRQGVTNPVTYQHPDPPAQAPR